MADQRAHIPFGTRSHIPELIRPDASDDISRHASSAAVEIPRIRHKAPSSTMTPAGSASEAITARIISPAWTILGGRWKEAQRPAVILPETQPSWARQPRLIRSAALFLVLQPGRHTGGLAAVLLVHPDRNAPGRAPTAQSPPGTTPAGSGIPARELPNFPLPATTSTAARCPSPRRHLPASPRPRSGSASSPRPGLAP